MSFSRNLEESKSLNNIHLMDPQPCILLSTSLVFDKQNPDDYQVQLNNIREISLLTKRIGDMFLRVYYNAQFPQFEKVYDIEYCEVLNRKDPYGIYTSLAKYEQLADVSEKFDRVICFDASATVENVKELINRVNIYNYEFTYLIRNWHNTCKPWFEKFTENNKIPIVRSWGISFKPGCLDENVLEKFLNEYETDRDELVGNKSSITYPKMRRFNNIRSSLSMSNDQYRKSAVEYFTTFCLLHAVLNANIPVMRVESQSKLFWCFAQDLVKSNDKEIMNTLCKEKLGQSYESIMNDLRDLNIKSRDRERAETNRIILQQLWNKFIAMLNKNSEIPIDRDLLEFIKKYHLVVIDESNECQPLSVEEKNYWLLKLDLINANHI